MRAASSRCVAGDPLNVQYLKVLTSAHGMLEQWQDAERVVARALRVSPQDPGLRSLAARVRARGSFWPQG